MRRSDEVVQGVTAALKEEGFGILTDIDVQATLKAKLGADMPPNRILGACNPFFAHQALQMEDKLGVLLPCKGGGQIEGYGGQHPGDQAGIHR